MLKMEAVVVGPQFLRKFERVQDAWKKALAEEGRTIGNLYDKTYHNWKTPHKPKKKQVVRTYGDEWYAEIVLTGRIYWFVHESIRRLRAVFSGPDDPEGAWSPKTTPRVLSSGTGSGRMVYASRHIDLDPYEAREFTEAIIEERKDKFQRRMQQATRDGVRAVLGG